MAKVLKNPIFAVMNFTIDLPKCKSILIRQMIYSFVQTGQVILCDERECNDVKVTHHALQLVHDNVERGICVDVEDCGAAYRFMMALLSVTPGQWLLTGSPRLLQRPMDELAQTLLSAGACLRKEENGWRIEGREYVAPRLTIDCSRSSQFASALLLIAPKIALQTLQIMPATVGSVPYIQLTCLCTHSNVEVQGVPQTNKPLGRAGDWSAALFWYAQALLNPAHCYHLLSLSLLSAQGDAVVAQWFSAMGVVSEETETGVAIFAQRKRLARPFVFDVANHIDAVPIMAALACVLAMDFTFEHTRNLAFKESDRARFLAEQLQPFAEIEWEEDRLRVKGKPRDRWMAPPYYFATNYDHRLAMAFTLFGPDAVIDEVDCLRKSYPELLKQWTYKRVPEGGVVPIGIHQGEICN